MDKGLHSTLGCLGFFTAVAGGVCWGLSFPDNLKLSLIGSGLVILGEFIVLANMKPKGA